MLIFSVCLNKLKIKSSVFSTLSIIFTQSLDLSTRLNSQPGPKSIWEDSKIGTLLNLSLSLPWLSSEKIIASMKEMELFTALKLTSSYLILSEDNINAGLVSLTSNYQSGSIFNTDQKMLSSKNQSKNKNKRKKKLN